MQPLFSDGVAICRKTVIRFRPSGRSTAVINEPIVRVITRNYRIGECPAYMYRASTEDRKMTESYTQRWI